MALISGKNLNALTDILKGSSDVKVKVDTTTTVKNPYQTIETIPTKATTTKPVVTQTGKTVTYTPVKSTTNLPAVKATDTGTDAGKLAKNAGKEGSDVINPTPKSSILKTLGIAGGAAAISAVVVSAFSGDPSSSIPGGDPDDPGIYRDEDGNPYYDTGSAAVDEALGFLQGQIDEIVAFLNSLFGGEEGAGGYYDPYTGEYVEQSAAATVARNPLVIIGLIVGSLLVGNYIYKKYIKGKKGTKTKGGKK